MDKLGNEKKVHEIIYISYGIVGEDEEEQKVSLVVAKTVEKAIAKFRGSLPKSLRYEIEQIVIVEGTVVE